MAKQEEILAAIRSHPDGVDIATLATEFETKPFALTKGLSDLKKKGIITHIDGIYQVAAAPVAATAEKPAVEKPPLPSDYDQFLEIGESIGVSGEFLKSISDYVFRSDPYSIETVHEALRGLHLRPDTIARWVQMWAGALRKPVPSSIESQVAATAQARPAPKRFSVVGENVVADPEGELSFYQALALLETKLAKQSQPQPGDSKIMELIVSRQDKSDSRIEALLEKLSDQRFGVLQDAVVSLGKKFEDREGQHQVTDKIALLGKGMDHVVEGLNSVRTDFKPLLEGMALPGQGQRQLRQRSAKEKADFSEGLDRGIAREKKLQAMEDRLFLGGDRAEPRPVPKPPMRYE